MSVDINNLTPEQQAQLLADLQAKQKEAEQTILDELAIDFEVLFNSANSFKAKVEEKCPNVVSNSNVNPELYTQYAGAVNIIANETARKNQLIQPE